MTATPPSANASAFFTGDPKSACSGDQLHVAVCNLAPCAPTCTPVNCSFSDWSAWGDCSCNQLRERHRHISQPSQCRGVPCEGPLNETEVCTKECVHQVDCAFGEWDAWQPTICANPGDQRSRVRRVATAPANGGSQCSGVTNETMSCDRHVPPPVDCALGEWGNWTACSKDCGGGYRTRSRHVAQHAENGGQQCAASLEELGECNTQLCDTRHVDCKLAPWSPWTSCEGGLAMHYRIRSILQQPLGTGAPCEGAMKEAEMCERIADCEVSEWTAWDACDRSCGGGQRTRNREITRNPSSGGKPCPEDLMETRGCNTEACDTSDCIVSQWSAWEACSASCGAGTAKRSRSFTSRRSDGLGCEQHLEEVKPCAHLPRCKCNDCQWGNWSDWTVCSSPCDGGQRSRSRHILVSPDPGCKPCEAHDKSQIEGCNLHKCHEKLCVDGEWADWGAWEPCSATCAGGQTWRSRTVKVEANECGHAGTGASMEHKVCNAEVPCEPSVDCAFGNWSAWSDCSARCAGVQRRHRSIATKGRGSGFFCEGPLEETQPCHTTLGLEDWLEPSMYLDFSQLGSSLGYSAAEPALFRFLHVANVDGRFLDLVVVQKSAYTGCDVQANGIRGPHMSALNVASGSRVVLAFRLVDSASGERVAARKLRLKVFDLDSGASGMSVESVHAKGFKGYVLSPGSTVQMEEELSDLTRFKASSYGTDDDDPENPMEATVAQEAKAVELIYEGISEVDLAFEVSDGSFCKTFLFSARACFTEECRASPCDDMHDPIDCKLSDWSSWGPCDATCGVGQQIRSREVVTEPAYGGLMCNDALLQTQRCSVRDCEACTPIDCAWEDWSTWGVCDRCDGESRRFRHIAAHASCGGKSCQPGDAAEVQNCSRSCANRAYCEWTEWQPYGACSATCGQGVRSRSRYLKPVSAIPLSAPRPPAPNVVTDANLEAKFEQLHVRSQSLRTSRLQVLALAFVAGGISLVAITAFLSRRARRRTQPAARWSEDFTATPRDA